MGRTDPSLWWRWCHTVHIAQQMKRKTLKSDFHKTSADRAVFNLFSCPRFPPSIYQENKQKKLKTLGIVFTKQPGCNTSDRTEQKEQLGGKHLAMSGLTSRHGLVPDKGGIAYSVSFICVNSVKQTPRNQHCTGLTDDEEWDTEFCM